MKALIILGIASTILFFAPKGTLYFKGQADRYCAKVKDGKVVVMHDGGVLNQDVILANGSQVKADGSFIDKDGVKRFLQEGECVDTEGKRIDPK